MTPSNPTLRLAETDAERMACHPVVHALRPHLASAEHFLPRIRRQHRQGWSLPALRQDSCSCAPAGYRWIGSLVHGRSIHVGDLVTTAAARGRQAGQRLLAGLEPLGRAGGAAKRVFDTAMANGLAQRFHFRHGLLATGLHFTKALT